MPEVATSRGRSFAVMDYFFDRPRVIRAINSYRRRTLSAQAAYAMRVMRNNQLPGGKAGTNSKPGEFPRRQQGDLARLTFFAYDANQDDAVVGPVGFARLPKGYRLEGPATIPQLLNEGGVVIYDEGESEKSRAARFSRIRGRRRNQGSAPQSPAQKRKRRRGGVARRTRQKRYRIEPRPFVRLTQEIVAPKLAEIAARTPFR